VAGGGFICLAATMSTIPTLPIAGLALLLGVDWFMATCRALTNMIGNGVACIVVAKWENAINLKQLHCVLNGETWQEAQEPEEIMATEEAIPAAGK
jgi:aerobic C4-dicarboxylate transport protein